MTRRLTLALILGIMASPALANLTTSQTWEFTNAPSFSAIGAISSYIFAPTTYANPNGIASMSVITGGAGHNQAAGVVNNVSNIVITLPNYENLNPLKVLDLEIKYKPAGVLQLINVSATDAVSALVGSSSTQVGDWILAKYKYEIRPNPASETVILQLNRFGVSNSVDYVKIDTDCIPVPAPAAALLALIGLPIIGWVKRRFA